MKHWAKVGLIFDIVLNTPLTKSMHGTIFQTGITCKRIPL